MRSKCKGSIIQITLTLTLTLTIAFGIGRRSAQSWGDDGTELDLEERKFTASMKFTNESMGPNEPLLNFYNRFKLR